jgi:prepilin-type N-terminal cleavage/methylation domain-containing protein
MKPVDFISSTRNTRPIHDPIPSERAFTFVELLVVIGILALLALMILPAMADVKNKGGRTQCAANLRQLARVNMIYANDFNTLLPPVQAGANPINAITFHHHTRFMWIGVASYSIPKSYTQVLGSFSNLGYLWGGNYVSDGKMFFCPAQWGTAVGEDAYSPLLRSDTGGNARSSFQFNPRANPADGNRRRYQKTSQMPPRKLFGVDTLDVSSSLFAHPRERGWNVLFTDGSVKFSQNNSAYNLIKTAPSGLIDATLGEQIYDQLEQDH